MGFDSVCCRQVRRGAWTVTTFVDRVHFHECNPAFLLHEPTSKDTRSNSQPVMICFPRVYVLQPEHRAHCSHLAVADGTVAHRLQSA